MWVVYWVSAINRTECTMLARQALLIQVSDRKTCTLVTTRHRARTRGVGGGVSKLLGCSSTSGMCTEHVMSVEGQQTYFNMDGRCRTGV